MSGASVAPTEQAVLNVAAQHGPGDAGDVVDHDDDDLAGVR